MPQISLTDDRILDAEIIDDEESKSNTPDTTTQTTDHGPVADHPAVKNVDIAGMDLTNETEGWGSFPHPATITAHIEEDMDADQAVFPEEIRDAIDELTDDPELGEFLVFDAAAAYEYLESLQKKSDLHFENFERRQNVINQLSNGRGYAKGANLSTYDKKFICAWEVRRRLAVRDFDEWNGTMTVLSKENSGLPNAE